MNRYFIKLSYKGTNYQGWQSQPGKTTIQGELNNALQLLLKEKVCLTGAGRTDTGVHAINYIAHFDSESPELKDTKNLIFKLNRFLSGNIIVHSIVQVNNESHSRYDAVSRTYHYLVSTTKNPFLEEFSLYFPQNLDIESMNRA